MKIIVKLIAFSAVLFLALSCTDSEESQQEPVSKISDLKKAIETKSINTTVEDEAHPKRKIAKSGH
jgi:hypothetical protein